MPSTTTSSAGVISAGRKDHHSSPPISFSRQSYRDLERAQRLISGLMDLKFSNSVICRVAVEALRHMLERAVSTGDQQAQEHFKRRVWAHSSQKLRRAVRPSEEKTQ